MSGFDASYSEVTWTTDGENQLTVSIDSKNIANIQIPDSVWYGSETITFTTSDTNHLTGLDYEKISVTPVDDILCRRFRSDIDHSGFKINGTIAIIRR